MYLPLRKMFLTVFLICEMSFYLKQRQGIFNFVAHRILSAAMHWTSVCFLYGFL